MVMGSSLKATKGIIKARCSGPNPHMGANIIAGGAQRSSLVEVVDPHKGTKGAVIKRCDALSGLMIPRYLPELRSTHGYYFAPAKGSKVLLKQALAL